MFASGLNGERALQGLVAALDKEQQQWNTFPSRPVSSSQEITDMDRDKEAMWLMSLRHVFDFSPETFVLALSVMDRVSTLVKIRPKYLRCVAISCLFIAAKTLEDDEDVPVTLDLVRKSHCGCSVSEILRMEVVILSKLGWNPKTVTAIDFLHMIHFLLMGRFPYLLTHLEGMTPSRLLAVLTHKLMSLLCHADMMRDRPSVVALALVSLELEQVAQEHWFYILNALGQEELNALQVADHELIACRERMSWLLSESGLLTTGYKNRKSIPAHSPIKSKKRKVEQTETDNIYEGIKRLYEENGVVGDKKMLPKRGSCASEVHQDAEDMQHPFVHAVAAV